MKLIYCTSVSYPSFLANRIQVLSMAKEFTKTLSPDFYFGGKNILGLTNDYGNIINFYRSKSFILAWEYINFIRDKDINHIYCREYKLLLFIILYNKLFFHLNLKYYYEVHEIPRKKKLFIKMLNNCDGIITITSILRKKVANLIIDGERIVCAPDGVDLSLFNNKKITETVTIRSELGVPPAKTIILYTGHLYEWKGVYTLADSASFFDSQTIFVFVGGTDKDVSIFRDKYKHVKNIKVLGSKPHHVMPLYLSSADVLVLPNSGKQNISRFFTSPLKMFEYMASEKPIVASDLPSLREVLNFNNAVLFSSDDPHSLADAIKKVLADSQLAQRTSTQALIDVQNYTWEKRVKIILNFITNLYDKR